MLFLMHKKINVNTVSQGHFSPKCPCYGLEGFDLRLLLCMWLFMLHMNFAQMMACETKNRIYYLDHTSAKMEVGMTTGRSDWIWPYDSYFRKTFRLGLVAFPVLIEERVPYLRGVAIRRSVK